MHIVVGPSNEIQTNTVERILKKGVRIWLENGSLRFRAPKGVLTPEDIEALKIARRSGMLAVLDERQTSDASELNGMLGKCVSGPLSYSQLAHWNRYRLWERPTIRQIAAIVRISGLLDVNLIKISLIEVARRHDALRSRIRLEGDSPVQEVVGNSQPCMAMMDLESVDTGCRSADIARLLDALIMAPIDVQEGPLFQTMLIRLSAGEHILLVAMEHMISDARSMNILLRDLFAIYGCSPSDKIGFLPEIPIQFVDYAARQRGMESQWLKDYGEYWRCQMGGVRVAQFPSDRRDTAEHKPGWGASPLKIDKNLKIDLEAWSRAKRTTLVMTMLSVYVALVSRWCNVSDVVVQSESVGRSNSAIQHTIGYFAAPLYLRIHADDRTSFGDLLAQVTDEYCKAHEHVDYSYMESRVPPPEFTRCTGFNWIPTEIENADSVVDSIGNKLTLEQIPFSHPMLETLQSDKEPMALIYDIDGEIIGNVLFPRARFSCELMERFTFNFVYFLTALLENAEQPIGHLDLR